MKYYNRFWTVIFLVFGFLAISSTSFALSYYISPTGNDGSGDGSHSRPWATLSNACSKVTSAGNTIFVNPGTYNDSGQCNLAPGVSIEGAGKAQTILKSSINDWYIVGNSSSNTNGNHTLSGFTLDGNNRTLAHGINITNRNNITIRECNFINIKDRAIDISSNASAAGPPSNYLTGITINNSEFTSCANHYSGDNSFGAIHINGTSGAELYNLTINESATTGQCIKGVYGWHSKLKIYDNNFTVGPFGAGNGCIIEIWNMMDDSEIFNNTFNNGYVSFVSGDKNRGTHSFTFHDNILNNSMGNEFSTDDLVIYNNYFNGGANTSNMSGGIGIWQTHEHASSEIHNITIHNNVITNPGNAGIYVTDKSSALTLSDIKIFNNTIDGAKVNAWEGAGIVLNPNGSGSRWDNFNIKNNIIMNSDGAAVNATGSNLSAINSTQADHNYFYNNRGGTVNLGATNNPIVSNNTDTAPDINWFGPKPVDYYQPSSQDANIVDAGVDVGILFNGQVPDIGAFEYGGSLSKPEAPKNLKIIN